MYIDLSTGATYAALLIDDGQTVILWNKGGESAVSSHAFQALGMVTDDNEDLRDLQFRFQWCSDGRGDIMPPGAQARAEALAAYAATNGGQISVHQHEDAPRGLAAAARRLGDLFNPRTR